MTDSLKIFPNRQAAGRELADRLMKYRGTKAAVLAIPRGGVVVGGAVALRLDLPLDTIVVRKIGAPFNLEYAIGALGPRGVRILNDCLIRELNLPPQEIERVIEREKDELTRRLKAYRSGHYVSKLSLETIIIVDDGLATGYTAQAAVLAVRIIYPGAKIVLAAPVGAVDTMIQLRSEADEVVCLAAKTDFSAVGNWYLEFDQVDDAEVIDILKNANVAGTS